MQKKTSEKEKSQVQKVVQSVSGQNPEAMDRCQTMLLKDYKFNLSDFALFMSVMKVKEAYEDVLSIILDESDLKLKEVKAKMNILEIGMAKGREEGSRETLIKNVEAAMKNLGIDLQKACEALGTSIEEYEEA